MKKFFTLIAAVCLTALSAMAAKVTEVTDIDAAIANGTVVNIGIGDQYLYGPNAQNTAMGEANATKSSSNVVIGYKMEKDGDAILFRCVTPAGADYSLWNTTPCYLNSQPVGRDDVTFNLGKNQDVAGGSSWTMESDGSLKNVGSGLYFNGTKVSTSPVAVKIVTIEADPEPEPDPLVIPASLQALIDGKVIFTLKSGDNCVYGPDQQNVAAGTWEQACAASNNATNYVLEADEYYYYLRAVKADGSDISAWGTKPCWLNTTSGSVVFEMGKDQDMKNGSSWLIEEVAAGKYSIKNVAKNAYMAVNGAQVNLTADVQNTWEFYVPAEPVEYTVNAKVTVEELSKKFDAQTISVVEEDGVATVTLPAAQAGPYKMASQKVKVNIDAEGTISMVDDQTLNFTDGANNIVVTVTSVEGSLVEGKIKVFVIGKGDNGKDVNVIYSSDEIVDPQSETIVWDFSDYTERVTLAGDNYSVDYNGMTMVGNTNATYTSDYVDAASGFHMNGTSSTTTRHLVYTPEKDGKVTVTYRSNNANATDRITAIGTDVVKGSELSALLENDAVLAAGLTDGATPQTIEADLKAGTTYYIYLASGGQSIMKVEFTADSHTAANAVVAAPAKANVVKYVENGKIVIVKDGKKFTVAGAQM